MPLPLQLLALGALAGHDASSATNATISNIHPRLDTDGNVVNAHAGGEPFARECPASGVHTGSVAAPALRSPGRLVHGELDDGEQRAI